MSQTLAPNENVLANTTVHPTLAVADIKAVRAFYTNKLGLEAVEEQPDGGVRFACGNGTLLHVYPRPDAKAAQNTVAAFETADLDGTMKALRANGVRFEEYDTPDFKTENGVVNMGGQRGCWFKDPHGNILGMFEQS